MISNKINIPRVEKVLRDRTKDITIDYFINIVIRVNIISIEKDFYISFVINNIRVVIYRDKCKINIISNIRNFLIFYPSRKPVSLYHKIIVLVLDAT